MFNPSMMYLLETRELFEGHLRTLQGLEYMVALGPRDFGGEAPIGQGTWVIRKQNRRKRAGAEDEVTVLATYFVVGDHIYMAPSVSNVIQARLLSTTQALNKLIATASSLPIYTPALGHRYFLPTPKTREISSLGQSVQQSRESTPAPDTQIQTEAPAKAASGTSPPTSRHGADVQTLYESFGQFLRYGKEFMDENPLLGEPGSFVFSSSRQHLQTQQEQAAKKAEQAALKIQTDARASATPQPSGPPTPQVKVEGLPPRRGSKVERPQSTTGVQKPRRRKSKAPPTPGSPLSVASLR